jgi:hypothetical protein
LTDGEELAATELLWRGVLREVENAGRVLHAHGGGCNAYCGRDDHDRERQQLHAAEANAFRQSPLGDFDETLGPGDRQVDAGQERRLRVWTSPAMSHGLHALDGVVVVGFSRVVARAARSIQEWHRDSGGCAAGRESEGEPAPHRQSVTGIVAGRDLALGACFRQAPKIGNALCPANSAFLFRDGNPGGCYFIGR